MAASEQPEPQGDHRDDTSAPDDPVIPDTQKGGHVDKNKVIEKVRKMRDIDGYESGDCISRRAVLAILEAEEDDDSKTEV